MSIVIFLCGLCRPENIVKLISFTQFSKLVLRSLRATRSTCLWQFIWCWVIICIYVIIWSHDNIIRICVEIIPIHHFNSLPFLFSLFLSLRRYPTMCNGFVCTIDNARRITFVCKALAQILITVTQVSIHSHGPFYQLSVLWRRISGRIYINW